MHANYLAAAGRRGPIVVTDEAERRCSTSRITNLIRE